MLNKLPEKIIKEYRRNRSVSARNTALDKRKSDLEDWLTRKGERERCSDGTPEHIVNILTPTHFDLRDFYNARISAIGDLMPEDISYNKRLAFANWLVTDTATRTPKTMAGAARALDVKLRTLEKWSRGDLSTLKEKVLEERMRSFPAKLLCYSRLLMEVDRGGKGALETYIKQFMPKDTDGKKPVQDKFSTLFSQAEIDEGVAKYDKARSATPDKSVRLSGNSIALKEKTEKDDMLGNLVDN